jgi:hypothetical protein
MQNEGQIDPISNFIKQSVLKRHSNKDSAFIEQETHRIYEDFGNEILDHFQSLLNSDQNKELEKIIKKTKSQRAVLGYLMESINSFEQKIIEYLMEYRKEYLGEQSSSID